MSQIIHYVGLDVHKDTMAVAIAVADGELRSYGTIGGKLADVDALIKKLSHPGVELRFCYEAGPTGYVIHRHLTERQYACVVVAPSLTPRRAGERIKTDRRDALSLARLYRAGELTAIRVPEAADEAVRDLVRARASAVKDQRRGRQQVTGLLLRQGYAYAGKTAWGPAHLKYLARLKLSHPAQQLAYEEYKLTVTAATERVERLTRALEDQLKTWSWEPVVGALMTLRGVRLITAMTLVAELGDLSRFADPQQLMAYLGLVPSEATSGSRRRQGAITKAGNEAARRALVEAAHNYRFPARLGPALAVRHEGQSEAVRTLAWKAQQRLCSRYRHLKSRGKKTQVLVTALARELAGFVWAVACTAMGKAPPARGTAPAVGAKGTAAKEYVLKPAVKTGPRRKAAG